MDARDFKSEIERFGFEKVLEVPFTSIGDHKYNEHFYVYFHKEFGVLLEFDTYNETSVNGGHYYYQWIVSKKWVETRLKSYKNAGWHPCFSSGGYIGDKSILRNLYEMIWYGSGDCRYGMIASIIQLSEDGKFITPWIKSDGIFSPSLLHYGDHDTDGSWDEGYKLYCDALTNITPKRFKMLPTYVQDAIRNGMREKFLIER